MILNLKYYEDLLELKDRSFQMIMLFTYKKCDYDIGMKDDPISFKNCMNSDDFKL